MWVSSPAAPLTMKHILITFLLISYQTYAQPVINTFRPPSDTAYKKGPLLRITSTEICNNNIDDDNNGLTDQDDFGCYLPASSPASCDPSPIIWGCNWLGDLYWANLTTGTEHFVGRMGFSFFDITWASNGKLYAVGGSPFGIYEVDPNTAATSLAIAFPPGSSGGNALAADYNGNLYCVYTRVFPELSIVRINIASEEICVVADLLPSKLNSAGDLTFLNESLYLSCWDNKIAKIDVQTGKVQGIDVKNSSTSAYFGLTVTGDGYLYAADNGKIYQVDPATMTARATPVFSFSTPDMYLYGLASYPELCRAPKCPYQTAITPSVKGPYCKGASIKLWPSDAICSRSSITYTWTTPHGNTIVADTLVATDPGMYYANYQMAGGVCQKTDSFHLEYTISSLINLGNDTSLCIGEPIYLSLIDSRGVTSFRWQDGSTTPGITVTQPGWYWIDAGTTCGIIRDSIYVKRKGPVCPEKLTISAVSPPPYCKDVGVLLQPAASCNAGTGSYAWITSSGNELTADQLAAIDPGKYYLRYRDASQNICPAIDSFLLEYLPLPPLSLGKDTGICAGKSIILSPLHTTGFTVFKWQHGATTPNLTITAAGWYWLDAGTVCELTRDSIYVKQKTELECLTSVIIPSAFTPNNDGNNDLFKPRTRNLSPQYEFKVYNRWGQQVFSTHDAGKGWDGTINGKPQDTGIYIWTCRYVDSNDQVQLQRGTVHLIR